MKKIIYLLMTVCVISCGSAQQFMDTFEGLGAQGTAASSGTITSQGAMEVQSQGVYGITIEKSKTISYKGNLADGRIIEDLSWAWSSSNACFVQHQSKKFTGKHVFFTGIIPEYSEITVTVIPKNKNANFSLYAYEIGADENHLVPDLPSCIRCESDYKWDMPWKGKTQDHRRTVKNLLSLATPYRVVIGVVGAEGLSEGEFTLQIETSSR